MTIKVAINGYGRIGRNILRAHYEGGKKHDLAIVALNDLGSPETNAHLTRYDTVHGKFPGKVAVDGDALVVNGDRIKVLAQRNPAELPWTALGVDVVLECTGLFTTKEKASAHLRGGAKKVVSSRACAASISSPSGSPAAVAPSFFRRSFRKPTGSPLPYAIDPSFRPGAEHPPFGVMSQGCDFDSWRHFTQSA